MQQVKKHETNIIRDRMKRIILTLVASGFTFASSVLSAQQLGCPIEGGYFKDFNGSLYSHHNPKEGAIILSRSNIEVSAVVDGKVSKVLNHGKNEYSLVLLSNDSVIISYSFLRRISVREGDQVRKGDVIGQANKNETGNFELRFSYRIGSIQVDPKELVKCESKADIK